jgi:hypothetical protein
MDVRKIMDVYDENRLAMPFGDIVAEKYKLVAVGFTNSGKYQVTPNKPLYFQPDTTLDYTNCVIKGIQLVTIEEIDEYTYPDNVVRDNISLNYIRNGIFYVSNLDREVIATMPLFNLAKYYNDGKLAQTYFTNHIWQNCYVEFADNGGLPTAANGMMFLVYYDEIKK